MTGRAGKYKLEKELQRDALELILYHPMVSWAFITTTGTVKGINGGRPFKVGMDGLADILGQLKDGRLLAIEIKLPGKKPTDDQHEHLDQVSRDGGVSGWADNLDKVLDIINGAIV